MLQELALEKKQLAEVNAQALEQASNAQNEGNSV